jgi:hypothetical protein
MGKALGPALESSLNEEDPWPAFATAASHEMGGQAFIFRLPEYHISQNGILRFSHRNAISVLALGISTTGAAFL